VAVLPGSIDAGMGSANRPAPPPHKLTSPGISQPPVGQRPAIRSGFATSPKQTQVGFPSPAESVPSWDDAASSLSDAINRAAPPEAEEGATPGPSPAKAKAPTPGPSPARAPAPGMAAVSGPPAATGARAATDPANDANGKLPFGDLVDDIDSGFERIVQEPGPSSTPSNGDLAEVRDLFNQIAATHMGPVRDFVIELKLGDPPREWVDVALPAVSTLRKSAAGMGLDDLCASLDGFVAALEVASSLEQATLTGEPKDRLLHAYSQVATAMPEVFSLDEERDRREPIIVQSLLKQVPDVRKVALDKLYGAGLTSLNMYYVAKPYDIAEAAGIALELAARIVNRFASYKREIAGLTPELGRSREYSQLDHLSNRLREQNTAFEVASKGWSRGAGKDKRRLRRERHETVLRINVLLARLGEVDLVSHLERLPFHTKVDALDEYLQQAKNTAMPHARPGGNQGK